MSNFDSLLSLRKGCVEGGWKISFIPPNENDAPKRTNSVQRNYCWERVTPAQLRSFFFLMDGWVGARRWDDGRNIYQKVNAEGV